MFSEHQSKYQSCGDNVQRKGDRNKKRKLMLTPPSENDCKSLRRSPLTRRALKKLEATSPHIVTPPSSIDSLKAVDVDPKKLKLIASQGGPDLRDLRGYSNSLDEANEDMPQGTENSSKASSADRADYEMRLVDSLICPASAKYSRAEIANLAEIEAEMVRDLGVLSPPIEIDKDHKAQFKLKNDKAITESDWLRDAFPYIAGDLVNPHSSNVIFNNLAAITKKELTKAKPDYYERSNPSDLKEKIREQLGKYIIPSTHLDRPMLPNFFLEAKGRHGSGGVAQLQACHDGALGARAIHRLRSHGKDPEAMYDRNAYTITATYCNDTLTMYAHHPTSSSGYGSPGKVAKLPTAYHMTLIGAWSMISDLETYRKGITAFRHLSAWTKAKRDEIIAAAREVPELAQIDSRVPDREGEDVLNDEESEEDDEEREEEDDEEPEGQDDERKDKTFQPSIDKKGTNLQRNGDVPSAKRRYSDLEDEDFDDELGHTPSKSVGKRPRHG